MWALVAVESPSCPGLSVDERWRLYANPDYVLDAPVPVLTDRLVHLVSHLLRLHHSRANGIGVHSPGDALRWLVASDMEINDDLRRDGHGPLWPVPSSAALPEGELAEWYYRQLPPSPTSGTGHADSDKHRETKTLGAVTMPLFNHDCGSGAGGQRRIWEMAAGQPGLSAADADRIRWSVAKAMADHAACAAGTMPAGLRRWADDVVNPKVDWRRAFGARIRKSLRTQAGLVDYSYRRPGRRAAVVPGVVLPSMVAPAPSVAVVVDTSGSMSDHDLGQCLGEIQGMVTAAGCHRSSIRVVACDALAYGVQEVVSTRRLALVGGGGTDMGTGITAAIALRPRPDLVVVLTDGITPWPRTPPAVPVIIGLVSSGGKLPTAPSWADVVEIPVTALRRTVE